MYDEIFVVVTNNFYLGYSKNLIKEPQRLRSRKSYRITCGMYVDFMKRMQCTGVQLGIFEG